MKALPEDYLQPGLTDTSISFLECYESMLASGELEADSAQRAVVLELQNLSDTLEQTRDIKPVLSFKERLLALAGNPPQHPWPEVKGLYIWGGVGTGKTLIVNLFFKHLPIEEKLRLNFHRFMQITHEAMKEFAGEQNPLDKVAEKFSSYRLLCIDEIHVTHISDAMLLVGLIRELTRHGVAFVFTSNREPDVLYKHGLQRSRFLPAIDMINEHTKVVNLDNGKDYRKQTIMQEDLYLDANDPASEKILEQHYLRLAGVNLHENRDSIIINGRTIRVKHWADSVVWFDFDDICNTSRSTEDYAEISRIFRTVILSNIPTIDNDQVDAGRRFINMVYVFYEHCTNMIVSAHAAPEDLYIGGFRLRHPFERTVSRLIEMRSEEYIAKQAVMIDVTSLNEANSEIADTLEDINGGLESAEAKRKKKLEPTRYGDWEKKGRCIDF